MVQEQIKTLPVNEAFTKWFIEDIGKNRILPQFAGYVRNTRILNKTTTIRLWRTTLLSNPYPWYIQWMVYNNEILFNANGNLCRLSWLIGAISGNGDVNYIQYWKFTIILTWVSNPWVWDWSILFQVWDADMPFDNNLWVPFDNPLHPIIWTAFTGYTMFAGNVTWYDNIMFISLPIVRDPIANTFTKPYDYKITKVWYSWETRAFKSRILWMIANYNNLYVFTQDTIETLGVWNATTVWGIVTLFTQPIGDGDRLCSPRALVSAGDHIFYITKALKIKTLNYIPWKADPEIGDLSDRPWLSIQGFIKRELNQDQSKASGVYVKGDNTIRFYVRSLNSAFENDLCIVYDLDTDSFSVDNNKKFAISVQGDNDIVYAWSHVNTDVYQDDNWFDDSWAPILFEYDTPNYWMWNPNIAKQFRGYTIAWALNTTTILQFNTYIDGVLKDTQTVTSANIDPTELWTVNIGWPNIPPWPNTLYPFEFTVDHGQIRDNGKKIRLQILCNQQIPAFYLDSLSFIVRPKGRYELNDVL